jgi:hypothetical protein
LLPRISQLSVAENTEKIAKRLDGVFFSFDVKFWGFSAVHHCDPRKFVEIV